MFFRTVVLFFILAGFITFGCTHRCENKSFYLALSFRDSTGSYINPVFERVYSTYSSADYAQNTTIETIPVDLSRDSTILIFEYNDNIDTLAFGYTIELNKGRKSEGYCLKLYNEHILNSNSFNNTLITFEPTYFFGGSNDEYSVIIHL